MPPRKPASRSTKAVAEEPSLPLVVEEGEAEESRPEFAEVAARVKAREEEPPPRRAAREKQEREVQEAAAALTVESVVRGIGNLRLEINAGLDRVSAVLTEQAKSSDRSRRRSHRTRRLAEF